MLNFRFTLSLLVSVIILTGCSVVTKLKEKLSTGNKEDVTNKESTKESTTSPDDMNYYNKYIEVMNKIQDAGEDVYRDYNSNIPQPSSITKNTLIVPVSLSISVGNLERTLKEYRRSYYDGGPLSKLRASRDMQNEIESDFKVLLTAMEEYYPVAKNVSDYYSKYEYKKDLSYVNQYDDDMKSAYDKYKTAYNKFSDALKKYKPKREIKDPNSISNPDERASTVMLNAYGNILDGAEDFYESFDGLEYQGDFSASKNKLYEFEKILNENKRDILNAEFTERTKFMKYNFEDYFTMTTGRFIDAGKKFFDEGNVKNENEFRRKYNDVVDNYNNMINSYNTSINSINIITSW